MSYIKSVLPLKDYRLFVELESGSSMTVDISVKLDSIKYAQLADETLFNNVRTDGDFVIWGGNRVKLTVNELMEVALLG